MSYPILSFLIPSPSSLPILSHILSLPIQFLPIYLILPCSILSYPISLYALSYLIPLSLPSTGTTSPVAVLPYSILSYPTLSCPILSYLIPSLPILSIPSLRQELPALSLSRRALLSQMVSRGRLPTDTPSPVALLGPHTPQSQQVKYYPPPPLLPPPPPLVPPPPPLVPIQIPHRLLLYWDHTPHRVSRSTTTHHPHYYPHTPPPLAPPLI